MILLQEQSKPQGHRNPLEFNLRFVLEAKVTSQAVKETLAEIVSRQEGISKIAATRDELDRQVTAIITEQSHSTKYGRPGGSTRTD